MSLAVEKMADSGYIEHPECIQCYSCVDNCKQDVLRVKFQRKKNK
jgi:NAD-dependent dihydropyrimidine dehydrogenase PreA subunit